MPECAPRTSSIVGTFLVGQRNVGIAYQDALCGVPLCGYAICGTWWAYLCPAELQLGSIPPESAGQEWLEAIVCRDLVLVAAGATTIDLVPEVCR